MRGRRTAPLVPPDSVISSSPVSRSSCDSPSPGALIVTPCPWTGRTLEIVLKEHGFAPIRTADATVAAGLCATGTVDAVVVDERMLADGAPTEAGRGRALLQAAAAVPVLPVLLVTHDGPSPRALEAAFEAGIWGLAPYPFGAATWIRQLGVWARAGIEGRRRLEAGLIDPVTALYNAHGLERRAREIDAAARRHGGRVACAVFTVQSTDVGEPGSGPAFDRLIADACRRVGRAADVFARMGTTTFAVVAPETDVHGIEALIRRIGEALDEATESRCTIDSGSFGVADARTASDTVLDLIARAAGRY